MIGGDGYMMRYRPCNNSGHVRHGSDTPVYGGFSPSPPASISYTSADRRTEGEVEDDSSSHLSPSVAMPGPVSMHVQRTAEPSDVQDRDVETREVCLDPYP